MKRTSYLLSLLGLLCIELVATTHVSSASASWLVQPMPTSAPSRPQGSGDMIQQFSEIAPPDSLAPAPTHEVNPADMAVREWLETVLVENTGALEVDSALFDSQDDSQPSSTGEGRAIDHLRGEEDGRSPESRNLIAPMADPEAGSIAPRATAGLLGTTQLIQNPGFETGVSPWGIASNGSIGPTRVSDYKYAGSYSMRMGGELGNTDNVTVTYDIDQLGQSISMPAGPLNNVTLEFWYRVDTAETYYGYDEICMRIWDPSDGTAVYSYCIDLGNRSLQNWAKVTWELNKTHRSYLAGKTWVTGFHVYNDANFLSTVWLDEVKITATAGSPEQCVDLLGNPTLDITDYGDGTGTIDFWEIFWQTVSHTTQAGYSTSPPYALLMVDDPVGSTVDPHVYSDTLDMDQFGQAFVAPQNLISMRVTYSRRYVNANSNDVAMSWLTTLDSDGYRDEIVKDPVLIYDSPSDWTRRYWEMTQATDAATLAKISGRSLVLTLGLNGDRVSPHETIYLDDVQVTACYQRAMGTVYVPTLMRTYQSPPRLHSGKAMLP